jgi:predicted MFS family arabinose efflux permease
MGVFATAQFIGAGVGATLAGLLLDAGLAIGNVFAAGAVVAMIWLACLLFLYERDV